MALVGVIVALCGGWLAACDLPGAGPQTLTLATLLPTSGAEGDLGAAMTRAVDLAVSQNASPGAGYALTVAHDTASGDQSASALAAEAARVVANPQVVGVVGPLDSQTAIATLPTLAQAGIAMLSPAPLPPGLTHASQAAAEGLNFAQAHPQGKPNAFFRLTVDDAAEGRAAADLALASPQGQGLGAHAVFLVDDGSASGKAQTAAFQSEFSAGGGAIAGSASMPPGAAANAAQMQAVVSAIIRAAPDAVFYAGVVTPGATLRRTLSQTGAPQLPLLVAGAAADDLAWSATVGGATLAANTTGLAPAPDPTQLASASGFVKAYQRAYHGAAPTPLAALAYDAAMVEISAIKTLIAAGKSVTRASLLGAVAGVSYNGVTGHIAFDASGDRAQPPSLSVYRCDLSGMWRYQSTVAAPSR